MQKTGDYTIVYSILIVPVNNSKTFKSIVHYNTWNEDEKANRTILTDLCICS